MQRQVVAQVLIKPTLVLAVAAFFLVNAIAGSALMQHAWRLCPGIYCMCCMDAGIYVPPSPAHAAVKHCPAAPRAASRATAAVQLALRACVLEYARLVCWSFACMSRTNAWSKYQTVKDSGLCGPVSTLPLWQHVPLCFLLPAATASSRRSCSSNLMFCMCSSLSRAALLLCAGAAAAVEPFAAAVLPGTASEAVV